MGGLVVTLQGSWSVPRRRGSGRGRPAPAFNPLVSCLASVFAKRSAAELGRKAHPCEIVR